MTQVVGRPVNPVPSVPSRRTVYSALTAISSKYHVAPLEEGPTGGRLFHRDLALTAITYILDGNQALVGQPGWGKTTLIKIVLAMLSGRPYDLFDCLEIRGHPQKTEEKMYGRLEFGKLNQGIEAVVWQGTFGLSAIIIDEVNRLSLEAQDTLLQVIDTGVLTYMNSSIRQGKKPTFMTLNQEDGDRDNILIPALLDRIDLITEKKYCTSFVVDEVEEREAAVRTDLYDPAYTDVALNALSTSSQRNGGSFDAFKKAISTPSAKLAAVFLKPEEKARIVAEIADIPLTNQARYFLQAAIAETNYSNQYGIKRASDLPNLENIHDKLYAGVCVTYGLSPRSIRAIKRYAQALAWLFGGGEVGLDHIRYILPYVYGHKAGFTQDFLDNVEKSPRKDWLPLAAAKQLVSDIYGRYARDVWMIINLVAKMQRMEELTDAEKDTKNKTTAELLLLAKAVDTPEKLTEKEQKAVAALGEITCDHPLWIDLLRTARAVIKGERAFYDQDE